MLKDVMAKKQIIELKKSEFVGWTNPERLVSGQSVRLRPDLDETAKDLIVLNGLEPDAVYRIKDIYYVPIIIQNREIPRYFLSLEGVTTATENGRLPSNLFRSINYPLAKVDLLKNAPAQNNASSYSHISAD